MASFDNLSIISNYFFPGDRLGNHCFELFYLLSLYMQPEIEDEEYSMLLIAPKLKNWDKAFSTFPSHLKKNSASIVRCMDILNYKQVLPQRTPMP